MSKEWWAQPTLRTDIINRLDDVYSQGLVGFAVTVHPVQVLDYDLDNDGKLFKYEKDNSSCNTLPAQNGPLGGDVSAEQKVITDAYSRGSLPGDPDHVVYVVDLSTCSGRSGYAFLSGNDRPAFAFKGANAKVEDIVSHELGHAACQLRHIDFYEPNDVDNFLQSITESRARHMRKFQWDECNKRVRVQE